MVQKVKDSEVDFLVHGDWPAIVVQKVEYFIVVICARRSDISQLCGGTHKKKEKITLATVFLMPSSFVCVFSTNTQKNGEKIWKEFTTTNMEILLLYKNIIMSLL